MHRFLGLILFVVILSLGCRSPEPRFVVFGYHTWWTGDVWTEYDFSAIDELLFFDLEVGPDGSIVAYNGWPDRWTDMIQAAQAEGTRVAPTLTLFDAAAFTSIFESDEAQERLLGETLRAVFDARADGIHIDFELFEDVSAEARRNYPRWVNRLKRELGDEYVVSVFTLAKDDADRYDERALARAADYLVVQGYDFHWRGGEHAGPNAPLKGWGRFTWEGVVDRYTSMRIPRSKILMATPFYGYEWPTETGEIGARTTGEGRIVSYAPFDDRVPELGTAASELARQHGLRRDPASGSPYYVFNGDDGWFQGWFEDEESLRAKFEFVHDERLGGVAIFPMGYDGGRFTELLHQAFPDSMRAYPRPSPEALTEDVRVNRGG